jgi:hypothetical protein
MKKKWQCVTSCLAGRSKLLAGVLAFGAAVQAVQFQLVSRTASPFMLSSDSAALTRLNISAGILPFRSGTGGFSLYDFNAGSNIVFSGGQTVWQSNRCTYTAQGQDFSIQAVFEQEEGFIYISGEVRSLTGTERAVILRYTIPLLTSADAWFGNSLEGEVLVVETNSPGTVVPVAAMSGADWGVSLSIPPDFPCCFGMTGTDQGLGVEFYFGLTPSTANFPNRAPFRFVIDTAQPGWGFRSALQRYYARYPDYYTSRINGAGFWNWNDTSITSSNSLMDEALTLYKSHGVPIAGIAAYTNQRNRDLQFGIIPYSYTIVGQRELNQLTNPPSDYATAMQIFDDFEAEWYAEGTNGPLHKKYANPASLSLGRNYELPAQIRNSSVLEADGTYRISQRDTAWAGESITFYQNPNPDLFQGQSVPTTGGVALEMIDEWFLRGDIDGVHMDSLGGVWLACMNYRTNHFPYARYPLTFDKNGRIGLHNMISHYEFLEDARAAAFARGKYLFGNGIDIYTRTDMPEHYNSVKNGRFFIFATMDAAGREIMPALMSRERLAAMRTFMGYKLLEPILYYWDDAADVERQINRSLVFNAFTAPNRYVVDDISYLTAANGYARDRLLLARSCTCSRILNDAGWQPVTYATVNDPEIACERYGNGDSVYFAVGNFGTTSKVCELNIDLAALGLDLSSRFSEIYRNGSFTSATNGRAVFTLGADETFVIKLSRSVPVPVQIDMIPDAVMNNVPVFYSTNAVSGSSEISKVVAEVRGLADGVSANLYAGANGTAVYGNTNTSWDIGEALVYRFTAYNSSGSALTNACFSMKNSIIRRGGTDTAMQTAWYAGTNAPSTQSSDLIRSSTRSDAITVSGAAISTYPVAVGGTENLFGFSSGDYVWSRRIADGVSGSKTLQQQDLTLEVMIR